jgi:hypothetical protein
MDGPTGIVQVPSRDLLPVWAKSDYFAVYINQEQRQLLPPELVDYLGTLEPVKIVRIDGIEYARLYDIRTAGVPPSLLDTSPNVSDWGGRVRLLTAVTRTAPVLRGESTRIEVFITPLSGDAVASGEVELAYRVKNQDGDILAQGTDPIEPQEAPRSIWRTYGRIEVPLDAVPGEYQVEIRFVDRDSGETLQGTFYKYGEPVGDWLELGTLEISPDVFVDED